MPQKYRVLEVGISSTSYAEVVDLCDGWIQAKRTGNGGDAAKYICITSVHGVITARDDREVRRILSDADVVTPDGMPLVWALRSLGIKNQQRVYGPTLMLQLCKAAAIRGHKVFLYGATEGCLSDLSRSLQMRYPGLIIAGTYSPPFRPLTSDEDRQIQALIANSGADLIFVGISTPKQEHWMDAHRLSFPGAVMIGVGAAFDFHAGRVRQAPGWMQQKGLEWLFRLLMEPVRLWRRYLLVTPRFVPLWMIQRLRMSRRALTE